MKKETLLRALEFFFTFAFMTTHIWTKYYGVARWVGVALTVVFSLAQGVLYFRRVQYSRRRVAIEKALWGPLILVFLYVAFFWKQYAL